MSPITKNFADARHRCIAEGGDLFPVVNDNMHVKMKEFVNKKRNQLPDYYLDTLYYWVGGKVDASAGANDWEWLSHYQPFDDYTRWHSGEDSIGCSVVDGVNTCDGSEALMVQVEADYAWRAADASDSTEVGYVCLSDCKIGYEWYPQVRRCLRISEEPA